MTYNLDNVLTNVPETLTPALNAEIKIWNPATSTLEKVKISNIPAGFTDARVFTKKVSLTSAQILNLFTTPITCIDAPGSGKAILIIRAIMRINYGTTTYTTGGDNFILRCSTTSNSVGQTSNTTASTLAATSSSIRSLTPITTGVNVINNDSIVATCSTTNPTLGDSTIDLYITYQIITL